MENGGGQVGRCIRFRCGRTGCVIGLPQHATRLNTASREETGKDVAPVISARRESFAGGVFSVRGDWLHLWRPSHFATHHDQRFIEQATFLKVVQKTAETLVKGWQCFPFQVSKCILMCIPSTQGNLDHADARFNQSACDQKGLSPFLPPVAVPHRRRLLCQVKRILFPRSA